MLPPPEIRLARTVSEPPYPTPLSPTLLSPLLSPTLPYREATFTLGCQFFVAKMSSPLHHSKNVSPRSLATRQASVKYFRFTLSLHVKFTLFNCKEKVNNYLQIIYFSIIQLVGLSLRSLTKYLTPITANP